MNDHANDNIVAANYRINNKKTRTSKTLKYKTKITGNTTAVNSILCAEAPVLLIYLSNFWRYFKLPLINCEVELNLSWSRNFRISEISRAAEVAANPNFNLPAQSKGIIETNSGTFFVFSAKLYIQ